MNYEFLDFTTLEKRKFFCEKEIILNRRLAEKMYLNLIPIYGTEEHPQFENIGQPIEYAVQMKEFKQEQLLLNYLENNQLECHHLEKLAEVLAKFHLNLNHDLTSPFGTYQQIHEPVIQNFQQIREYLKDEDLLNQIRFRKNP